MMLFERAPAEGETVATLTVTASSSRLTPSSRSRRPRASRRPARSYRRTAPVPARDAGSATRLAITPRPRPCVITLDPAPRARWNYPCL